MEPNRLSRVLLRMIPRPTVPLRLGIYGDAITVSRIAAYVGAVE